MNEEDKDRMESFKRAWRRGDVFAQMRLVHEEWLLAKDAWSNSPLRHFAFGLVIAIGFRILRELGHGSLLLDLIGLMAFVWYGGKTIFEILRK